LVKEQLQELINQCIFQVSQTRKRAYVSVIELHFESNKEVLKPTEIHYEKRGSQLLMNQKQPIVICVLSPFPYKSSKAVPWNYDATAFVHEPEERAEDKHMQAMDKVIHISEGSGMNRSGRIFAPKQLRRETNEVAVEAQKRKEVPSQDKRQESDNQSAFKEDDEFVYSSKEELGIVIFH
jgi:hypothetical protein